MQDPAPRASGTEAIAPPPQTHTPPITPPPIPRAQREAAQQAFRESRDALVNVLARAGVEQWRGNSCRCPFHDDKNPSAGIHQDDDGVWRFKCHGCEAKGDVFDMIARVDGIPLTEALEQAATLAHKPRSSKKTKPAKPKMHYATAEQAFATIAKRNEWAFVRSWTYPGDVLRVGRFDTGGIDPDTGKPEKTFRPVSHDGNGWVLSDPPGPLPLYLSDKIPPAGPVIVVEGEKTADAARSIGLAAFTSAHGSKSAKKSDWQPLAGREIIILPDNDDKGREYAEEVASIVGGLTPPATARIVELPDLPDHGDLVEWIAADGPMGCKSDEETREAILSMAATAPAWTPSASTPAPGSEITEAESKLCSDIGNAARFTAAAQGRFLYCGESGRWLHYDGRRWSEDTSLRAIRLAKTTALNIYKEARAAAKADKEEQAKRLAKWALDSQRRERLSAMVDLARCELSVSAAELDADPWLFNVLNGTVNLRTGKMTPHGPEDRITRLAPVVFDPAAKCPRWDAFLDTIMAGDKAMIGYLQRVLGMCLTGDVSEQALFLFYGTGANGKSVCLDTLTGLMGDYATEAAPDLLIERRNPEHPTQQADLCGRRLVVASETEEGGRLRVQLVKRLTGNARIKARFMRRDYFEFDRTHKLIMATNNRPAIRETTHAIWRRLKLTPFTVTIPDIDQDKNLLEKLRAGWSGILNWAIAGCTAWQRDGLDTPEKVDRATADYESEQDILADFLDERCIVTPAAFVSRADIYKAYTDWATTGCERFTLDKNNFYERLRAKHLTEGSRRIAGVSKRGFQGIGLRTEHPDDTQK